MMLESLPCRSNDLDSNTWQSIIKKELAQDASGMSPLQIEEENLYQYYLNELGIS